MQVDDRKYLDNVLQGLNAVSLPLVHYKKLSELVEKNDIEGALSYSQEYISNIELLETLHYVFTSHIVLHKAYMQVMNK